MIKEFGATKIHLGCEYTQVNVGATTCWIIGYSTHTSKALKKVCTILKITNPQTDKLTNITGDHTKLYSSPIFGKYPN